MRVFSFLLCLTPLLSFAQLTPSFDDIFIPMRDGDSLQADVYIPANLDSAEVVLIQTPYNKDLYVNGLPLGILQDVDNQPFIWVIVDWRGFYGSGNADVSDVNRGEDGFDIMEWITQQTWHKNRIATWGPSALGGVQYQTMIEKHPNYTCAIPQVATAHQSYENYFYGGVLEEARLNTLDALGYGLSPLVMANVYKNALWNFLDNSTWYPSEIHVPTLQMGGWYDHNIDEMMDFYKDSRNISEVSVRNQQWLLVGPWVHGGTGAAYVGSVIQGELTYPNAGTQANDYSWDFLNYYMLDSANGWDSHPKINFYQMGENEWKTSNNQEINHSTEQVLYLNEFGTLQYDLGLGQSNFQVDPSDPSPTIGGATLHPDLDQGPYDQSTLEQRSDVISFETIAFSDPIEVRGRIKAILRVSSDRPDGDLVIRLVDEYPDGRNMLITDGVQRLRFRDGDYTESGERFMQPGVKEEVQISLPFTCYTFMPGHKLKIYISGNSGIRWNVNLQDGGEMYQSGTGQIANYNIHHDSDSPSRIVVPTNSIVLGQQENKPSSIHVYPNPSSGIIQIKSDEQISQIELTDLKGRLVFEDFEGQEEIKVDDLPSGIYFLKITLHSGSFQTKKIQIQ